MIDVEVFSASCLICVDCTELQGVFDKLYSQVCRYIKAFLKISTHMYNMMLQIYYLAQSASYRVENSC